MLKFRQIPTRIAVKDAF